jgi:hypothetical protein
MNAQSSCAANAPQLPEFVDAAQLAKALRITKGSVRRRARKEMWPYTYRSGKRRLYAVADLPIDVQIAPLMDMLERTPAPPDPLAGYFLQHHKTATANPESTVRSMADYLVQQGVSLKNARVLIFDHFSRANVHALLGVSRRNFMGYINEELDRVCGEVNA